MLKPTKDRLIVKPAEEKKPEKGKEAQAATSLITGTVEQAGPDVKAVKVGETVKFAPYGIDEILVDKVKMLVVGEDMILVHGKE